MRLVFHSVLKGKGTPSLCVPHLQILPMGQSYMASWLDRIRNALWISASRFIIGPEQEVKIPVKNHGQPKSYGVKQMSG